MKVVFLCLDMDPRAVPGDSRTGAGHLYVDETLTMFRQAGIQTLAFTSVTGHEPCRTIEEGSVTLRYVDVGDWRTCCALEFGRWCCSAAAFIREELEAQGWRPHLIHAVYWRSGAVALALQRNLARSWLVYSVVSLGKRRHTWTGIRCELDRERERIETAVLQRSAAVLAVSERERADAIRLYNCEGSRVHVVGRGLDTSLFSSVGTDCNDHLNLPSTVVQPLLFVGRLIESKGLDLLLQVHARLLERLAEPLSLVVAGGTSEEVRRARRRWTSGDPSWLGRRLGRVVWLGRVPRNSLPDLYRRAWVTCVPSHYDPGPRVVLESLACGTPVVMSRVGYADDVVKSGVNGYVVDSMHLTAWVKILEWLVNNPSQRHALSVRARRYAERRFTLERFYRRQFSIIERVAR